MSVLKKPLDQVGLMRVFKACNLLRFAFKYLTTFVAIVNNPMHAGTRKQTAGKTLDRNGYQLLSNVSSKSRLFNKKGKRHIMRTTEKFILSVCFGFGSWGLLILFLLLLLLVLLPLVEVIDSMLQSNVIEQRPD